MWGAAFETNLPAAFSLYIATKILQEWKGFQAHFNQIQDQSWLDILDFTLLLFMWFNKNTGQLSQLHSHVHVTVNVSTHCTVPPSLFHFSSINSRPWNCRSWFFCLELLRLSSWLGMCSCLPTGQRYPLSALIFTGHRTHFEDTTLSMTLSGRHKHLLAFGTCSL